MTRASRGKILRNVGFNFVGAAIPVVLTLFTVPIYLRHIGAARYGVVLVAWSLLGYVGFMDFGISRATTNALARMTDLSAQDAKVRVFWSSFLINGCLGLAGVVESHVIHNFCPSASNSATAAAMGNPASFSIQPHSPFGLRSTK